MATRLSPSVNLAAQWRDSDDEASSGERSPGKFLIESLVGGGAMGAVYKAKQLALDKIVAIKVMHRELAKDETFVARFQREAKAASKLDHPNSMRVIDFGEEPDGLLYIAMEFLDGKDLFAVIEEGWPLSDERIVDDPDPGARGARRRARHGHRPPRSQAREHHGARRARTTKAATETS